MRGPGTDNKLHINNFQWCGSGFGQKPDPGLRTSNEGRFKKLYKMNTLDNFKLSFCFHTFGVRRPLTSPEPWIRIQIELMRIRIQAGFLTTSLKTKLKSSKVFIERILGISLRSRYWAPDPDFFFFFGQKPDPHPFLFLPLWSWTQMIRPKMYHPFLRSLLMNHNRFLIYEFLTKWNNG